MLASVREADAVRLFVARAVAARDSFRLTAENAHAVADICRDLDGLPLAIELAIARSNVLDPAAMLARLSRRLPLLAGGPPDQPPSLRTMRSAIAWSYDLLTEAEQSVFRRLSVFAGDITLDAVERVMADEPAEVAGEGPLLDTLCSLVDKSLLQSRPTPDADVRFTMLGTVREFALAELSTRGELAALRGAHARAVLAAAERAGEALTSPDHVTWLDRLEADHADIRAALGWAFAEQDGEMLLRFGVAIWWFWEIRGYWAEGRSWLERGLALGGGSAVTRARARYASAAITMVQGDLTRSLGWAEEALASQRSTGDVAGAGQTLLLLGRTAQRMGDRDAARRHFTEALDRFEQLGDQRWIASALHNLGLVAAADGDDQRASDLLQDSQRRWLELGFDRWGLATCIPTHLADIARRGGEQARAAALYRESLRHSGGQGDRAEIAGILAAVAAIIVQ